MIEDEHQPYDKSSKWLIQHHGGSILRLAGIEKIATWRPAQAEVVQPSQMPDGLLEVRLEGEAHDDLFLLEVSTYPERRVEDQLTRDLMLVYPYRTPNAPQTSLHGATHLARIFSSRLRASMIGGWFHSTCNERM